MKCYVSKKIIKLLIIVILALTLSGNAYAYIEPGTTSYILQLLIGLIIGASITIRMSWKKIKSFMAGFLYKIKKH